MNKDEEDFRKRFRRWFEEKGKHFEKRKKNIDLEYFFELLDIAADDLSASKFLFRRRFYAHSIYLLQQSVEKIGKSILIYEGYCSKEQLKNEIGHNASIYLINRIMEIHDSLALDSVLNEETNKIVIWVKEFLLRYKEERVSGKTMHVDYEEANNFMFYLFRFPRALRYFKKLSKQIQRELKKEDTIQSLIQNEVIRIQEETKKPIDEELKKQIERDYNSLIFKDIFALFFIIPSLILYTIVCFSFLSMNLEIHSNATRYPDLISYYKYTKKLDIVKLYPKMAKITGKTFKSFNLYLDLSTDNKLAIYFEET